MAPDYLFTPALVVALILGALTLIALRYDSEKLLAAIVAASGTLLLAMMAFIFGQVQ